MTIQTTELLQLFIKAEKLDLSVAICQDKDGDYIIKIAKKWGGDFNDNVIITQNGESNWKKGNYSFDTMMDIFDEMLKEKLHKEIKARKRQELIDKLTPEERELLGVK